MIRPLTETEFRILDALRVYRYLTVKQLLRLGVTKNQSRLYTVMRGLTGGKRPFVGAMKHGILPGHGRLPHCHYLTRKGANLLAEALQIDAAEVPYPKSAVPIRNHFFHRLHCVDCEISVRLWAGAHGVAVDFYHSYFDVTGANRSKTKAPRRALTKIDLNDGNGIIPDAVFQMIWPTGECRLFVMEVHNQNRTKRIHDKLAEYRYAIGEGAINRQFDYEHAPRILAVFENDRFLELTKKRMAEGGAFGLDFSPFFFLGTLEGMATEFDKHWKKIAASKSAHLFDS